MSSLGVYIHIPFCLNKCPYCNFNSYVLHPLPEAVYIDSILSEITTISRDHFSDFRTVDTIYFGGGTPSLFSPDSMEQVLEAIGTHYSFSNNAEVTLEANPCSLNRIKLKGLLDAGINRLNLGFQSLKDCFLQRLGRIHSAEQAYQAFDLARETGFHNLGVDLIYGIPGQETGEWEDDLEAVIQLKPEHVSAYNLTVEPHTPFSHWVKQGTVLLPSEEKVIELYERTHTMLSDAGYDHYEISNFALSGYRSRHNQKYWILKPYMGIGAGAHSYKKSNSEWGLRWWNVEDPYRYMGSIEQGQSSIENVERLSKREAFHEAIFLGLRQFEGIHLSELNNDFGSCPDETWPLVSDLIDARFLEATHDGFKLTSQGMLLSDEIVQHLF